MTVWRPSSAAAVQAGHAPPADPGAASEAGAQREIEARVKAAYAQGQAAGEAAGEQRAALRLEPALRALNAVIQELAGLRKRFRADAEEDTVKLAIAIARRVLHREIATDSEAILGLVIAAFHKLNARELHRLRVSPGDAAVIEENRARLELPPAVELSPDASLVPGSAIFETSRGELDASVDTQLAEIERGFADIVKRRPR